MSYTILVLILGILGLGTAVGIYTMYISFERKKGKNKGIDNDKIVKLEERIEILEKQNKEYMKDVKTLNEDMNFYKKLLEDKNTEN